MKTTETPPANTPSNDREARYRARAFEASKKAAALEKELAKAQEKLTKAEKAFDEAPLKIENEKLKADLRNRNHKDAFRKAAVASGFDPEGVDDLYTLSGWKAEKDAVDDKALGELVEGLKTKQARYLKGDSTASTSETPVAPEGNRIKPPPANDRGAAHNLATGHIRLTGKELADPKFMLGNKALYDAAAKGNVKVALPDRKAL